MTNGTLLSDPGLRKELLNADLVMPSLDSGLKDSFLKINRPEKSLDIKAYIEGIASFRKEFKGKLHLEIFIIPGVNDSNEDIEALKKAVYEIQPDEVLLNTLDRPGAVFEIKAASNVELERVKNLIGYKSVKIISKGLERKNIASYRSDREESILGTILRRPCTIEDLSEILGLHMNDIGKYLDVLVKEEKVEAEQLERGIFYKVNKDKI